MKQRMHAAAQVLVGEHDFSCVSRRGMPGAIAGARICIEIDVARDGGLIVLTVRANAFLHHMVRNIAGLLIAVGTGERRREWLAEVLAARDRTQCAASRRRPGTVLRGRRYPASSVCRPIGLPRSLYRPPVDRRAAQECRHDLVRKIMPSRIKTERRTRSVPEGLWIKCPACDAVLYRAELERNLHVCPKCSHHMRIGARDRLARFLDPDSGVELGGRCRARGSAQVPRQQALQGSPDRGPEERPARRMR